MSGTLKSSASKLCKDIDERVNAFLKRLLNGEWHASGSMPPSPSRGQALLKVREGGQIFRVASI
jgi:putative transposase